MIFGNPVVLAIFGGVAIIAGVWLSRNLLSADARRERRRRRSNAPICSTAKRPMVKFSVKTKKDRRK